MLGERLETAREELSAATAQRAAAESALAEEERRLAASARAEAVRAERLSRLRAQVGAARSKAAAAQEEAGRLADAVEQARSRAGQAQQEYEELQELCAGRDDDRAGLTGEHEQASGHAQIRPIEQIVGDLNRKIEVGEAECEVGFARRECAHDRRLIGPVMCQHRAQILLAYRGVPEEIGQHHQIQAAIAIGHPGGTAGVHYG